mgnify:CR=1 FL=1|tara:strand:+ start:388 stop:543 length:156 start_codon:yes stop_codon:yes gene_type:complete
MANTDTFIIELKHGKSRVIFNGHEIPFKTAWLKSFNVNDLLQECKRLTKAK